MVHLRRHHLVPTGGAGEIQGMLQLLGENPHGAARGQQAGGLQRITAHCRDTKD